MTAGFLLASFPRQASSDETTDMLMQAYQMAIDDAPTWSVEEAGRRWVSGKCGPRRFAPTPPELRCAADDVVMITRGKIASLRKLSKAEVASDPTPEQLQRATEVLQIMKAQKTDTTMDTSEKAA